MEATDFLVSRDTEELDLHFLVEAARRVDMPYGMVCGRDNT